MFLLATVAGAQQPKLVVKIAPQSLSKALQELAAQTDVQIVYQSNVAKDLETPGSRARANSARSSTPS